MADAELLSRMRADWDARAREDANYYAAFGRRRQEESEFLSSAEAVASLLRAELPRLRGRDAALEIGCGPGRLMRPMSRHFAAVHGVDVSIEMVRIARERLRDLPNTQVHPAGGADLAPFPAGSFDFVYSFAVFQHIPGAEVVFRYLEEAWRVLTPDGILRCQINGLPPSGTAPDTWNGACIPAPAVAEFARRHDFQLLALEGAGTQYMWVTLRKKPAGWNGALAWRPAAARLRHASNARTGEPAVPASGPLSAVALWIDGLPPECDLNSLELTVDGAPAAPTCLAHPAPDGVVQLNAWLPAGVRTGLVPIELGWLGRPLAGGWMRVIPPGPAVARLVSLTDGIDLLAARRSVSGLFKACLVEVERPEDFAATLDGLPVRATEYVCTDPVERRYEFNFRTPEGTAAGTGRLAIFLGSRLLATLAVVIEY